MASASVTNTSASVSGPLTLAPGSYFLSAKLYVTHAPQISDPTTVDVICTLEGDQENESIDLAKVSVSRNQFQPVSLVGTAEVAGAESAFDVLCTSQGTARGVTASSIQLVAVKVDGVAFLP